MIKKIGLHPRNKHKSSYPFDELVQSYPKLAPFVKKNNFNTISIDFSDQKAVIALNAALLKHFYHIDDWNLPENYLCPPIPGRADYIHSIADLLSSKQTKTSKGETISLLDIGTGASCIYPLIAQREYGWKIIGSDIDEMALANARQIIAKNQLESFIEIRHQKNKKSLFETIIHPNDFFDATICNPPFHSSAREAELSAEKKNRHLKLNKNNLNFQGLSHELWCEGGEERFIINMIHESLLFKNHCHWFSTLVSKQTTLPAIYAELKKEKISTFRTIDMAQGQKKSRIVAWSFMPF
ncbi:MAG: 23S rRNA (adenine(1618)-N(6))-methyltransferase RlmF [Bacteriovorax sp.]|nr:23S rRNA (adenine(1618)-N(6))-methyltransferase RlmF [Bacteriovorax sp.]